MRLESWHRDVRFAIRGLRRDKTFSAATTATLALAVALNVTVFVIATAWLYRGYPLVKRNDQLVYVQEIQPSGLRGVSFPDFEEWTHEVHAFDGIGLLLSGSRVAFRTADGRSSDLIGFKITVNSFGLLGVAPTLGRDFSPADAWPGAAPVTILNYRFWQTRFGSRPDILGTTVWIDGAPTTVIGVMPERFDFPDKEVSMWIPVRVTAQLRTRTTDAGGYLAFGRLRAGATVTEARVELETINRRLQAFFPELHRGMVLSVSDNAHYHGGPNGPITYRSLWAGAWLVLLIACANVSNLTFVRAVGRWRDFSTRVALGADTWETVRLLAVEGFLLTALATIPAWVISVWAVRTWAAATASQYQIADYRLDAATVAYLIVVSVATAIIFSVPAIVRLVRLHRGGALTVSARGATSPLGTKRLAAALVAGQMALAMVLLCGAGVLVRSLMAIVNADTGVRHPEDVLIGSLRLPSDTYSTPERRLAYIDRVDAQLRSIPGVEKAGIAGALPVRGGQLQAIEIEGIPNASAGEITVTFVWAGLHYFETLGGSIVAGRDFDAGDRIGSADVALVNRSYVEKFGDGNDPLGRRFRLVKDHQRGKWRTIVGVVSNIMQGDAVRQHFQPVVYLPLRQEPPLRLYFFARAAAASAGVARAMRSRVEAIDDLKLADFTTLNTIFAFNADYVDVDHMVLGKGAAVAPVFGGIALLLAGLGLYAMIAHSVVQRTREIGIRIAIGAAASDVRRLVVGDGMAPVLIGLSLGLGGALVVNRLLESQLVGVAPYDRLTLTTAPIVLLLVAWAACSIPAGRAVRVDPAIALRHD